MSKLIAKLSFFLLSLSTFYFLLSPLALAAQPGLNLINNPNSVGLVPNSSDIDWLVFTPESPQHLVNWKPSANNLVIRIHSAWTNTGKLMLGTPGQQQQVATDWCQSLNNLASTGKKVYVEPFNELEHNYERLTPTGGISLNPAILRAKTFIDYLGSCLSSPTIISPAMDPQSVDFATTSQAFSNFNIISCHPYRNDTINKCTSGVLAGKQYLFTEIGVDKGGPKYDNCLFIQQFCQEGFIENLNNVNDLMAYFLFTFAPGNFDGFWQLTSQSVVKALKGQCSSNLITNCDSEINPTIDKIVNSIKNNSAPNNVAPIPNRGINLGPLTAGDPTLFQRIANWFDALFNRATSNLYPFPHKKTEQYVGEDGFATSGDFYDDMITIYQPPASVTEYVNTVFQSDQLGMLEDHDVIPAGYSPQTYQNTTDYLGYGQMFSIEGQHYDFYTETDRINRDYFDLQSGASTRITPDKMKDDDTVNKILCQLAASQDPNNSFSKNHPEKRLFDKVLGYMKPVLEEDFIYNLPIDNPNQGPGIVDRRKTKLGDDQVPIRISTIFCINPNLQSFLDACTPSYGTISPDVCSNTPDWLKTEGVAAPVFRSFWPKLKEQVMMLSQNASSKAFLETCQEQNLNVCDPASGVQFSDRPLFSSNFGQLSAETRTDVLDNHKGAYNKSSGNTCYACRAIIIYFPNLTEANQTIQFTGSMTTPYKSHQNLDQTPNTISYSDNQIEESGVNTPDSNSVMGLDNRHGHLDQNLNVTENLKSFFSRQIDTTCQPVTVTTSEGQQVTQTACQGQRQSKLQTILYVSPQTYQYINYSKNFYNYMMPSSIQAELKESLDQATDGQGKFINLTNIDYKASNQLGGKKSLSSLVSDFLNGGHHSSGNLVVDDKAKKIAFGENQAAQQKIQQLMFTPYAWQKQPSTQESVNYQSNRPNSNISPNTTFNNDVLDYCNFISQNAQSRNLEPSLIAALISVESNGNPSAISNQGAVGLMQVMPSDAKDPDGNPLYFDCGGHDCFSNRPTTTQLLDPKFNIEYGTQLLSGMINYWGSLEAGLTHYGPTGYDGYADLVLGVQSQNPTACN